MRRDTRRDQKKARKAKALARSARSGLMPQMRGIERAPEYADPVHPAAYFASSIFGFFGFLR